AGVAPHGAGGARRACAALPHGGAAAGHRPATPRAPEAGAHAPRAGARAGRPTPPAGAPAAARRPPPDGAVAGPPRREALSASPAGRPPGAPLPPPQEAPQRCRLRGRALPPLPTPPGPPPPHAPRQDWRGGGARGPKSVSVRTHGCPSWGVVLDRDEHAARNMVRAGQARRGAEALARRCSETLPHTCGGVSNALSTYRWLKSSRLNPTSRAACSACAASSRARTEAIVARSLLMARWMSPSSPTLVVALAGSAPGSQALVWRTSRCLCTRCGSGERESRCSGPLQPPLAPRKAGWRDAWAGHPASGRCPRWPRAPGGAGSSDEGGSQVLAGRGHSTLA